MSILNNSLLLGAPAGGATGYSISRSLRFNSADSAYLSRTPASAGNRKTWTWAGWVKRSGLSTDSRIFSAATSGSNQAGITFNTDNTIEIFDYQGSYGYRKITTQVFRDASAWYHFVLTADFDNGTAEDRLRFYVNGSRVTTFSTNTNPSSGYASGLINSAILHALGAYSGPAALFNGYLADIHFIDGQALDPSSFTEVSATTGRLEPKAYTGTYGTNGFRLDFSNPLDLGNDAAGTNDWTPNNLSGVSGGPTSVAAASGALPVYNTTDTYGTTKGTGTRADGNSSSIVVALPMEGANNGTTFADESAVIKGSGTAKTVVRNGDTKTVTSQSKFYGSSGYFDGSGDYLNIGSSSDYLFGTGDFTIESWFYITTNSGRQDLCGNYTGEFTGWGVSLGGLSNAMYFYYGNTVYASTSANMWSVNTWSHVAVVRKSSILTIYLNGVPVSSETVTANISTTSFNTFVGAVTNTAGSPQLFVNGYLQDFRIYKGAAKYAGSFNPPAATQNPQLARGNDSLVDTPTSYGTDTGAGGEVRGNYATFLGTPSAAVASNFTRTNGNLDASGSNANQLPLPASIFPSSGKWYCELVRTSGSGARLGVVNVNGLNESLGNGANGWCFLDDGRVFYNGSASSYGSAIATNDIFMIALDIDAGKVWYGNNGTWFASGNPATGANASQSFTAGQTITFAVATGGACAFTSNWGARPFAYTAPSGFKALNTANLPAPLVTKPSDLMDVVTYTGNTATTRSITGLNFSPDLVWIKNRGSTYWNVLFDVVRGVGNQLSSNQTDAELASGSNVAGKVSSFDANGFTLASGSSGIYTVNENNVGHVAWCWDAGSSTVTNTQGSISSQVRANASAGFSVVTWTGPGSGSSTVGHGLGVKPGMVIVKARSATGGWWVTHSAMNESNSPNGWSDYLSLNTTDAKIPGTYDVFRPHTSSVITLGADGVVSSAANYVAYCFAPVAGYSSAFTYTGNGSASGPFVYLGFRPRFFWVKRTDAAGDWWMYDAARNPYNVTNYATRANSSAAEVSDVGLDMLSNGFRYVNDTGAPNINGATYVGFAWAESPFQYARAR
jgi:hypothetical protein